MKLSEAAKIASKSGKAIMLNRNGMNIHLLPTNTTSAIIESIDNGRSLIFWHPALEDIISEDWKVTDDFRIKQLPSQSSGPTGVPGVSMEDTARIHHLEAEWYRTR